MHSVTCYPLTTLDLNVHFMCIQVTDFFRKSNCRKKHNEEITSYELPDYICGGLRGLCYTFQTTN